MTLEQAMKIALSIPVDIRDPQVFQDLNNEQVSKYVKSKGWREAISLVHDGKPCTYWMKEDVAGTLPIPSRDAGDYLFRMKDVLSYLSRLEGRTQLSILLDIYNIDSPPKEKETPRPTISSTFYPGEGWGRIRISTSRRILERDFSNEKDQNQIWDLISKRDINEAELSKLGFRESNESISR